VASDPTGRIIRNLLVLQRIGNTLTSDVLRKYRKLFQEVAADIARIDPTGVMAQSYRAGRTDKLVQQIRDRVNALTPALQKELRDALAQVGKAQGTWAALTIETSIGLPGVKPRSLVSVNLAKAILDSRVFGDPDRGRVSLLSGWVDGLQETVAQRMEQQIRAGMLREETLGEMITRVRTVREQTERNAEAIVRTAVNDISNAAHDQVYRENSDLLSGVQFVATLDDRTTVRCAALDGSIFKVDDQKKPVPPLHINCRSIMAPVVDWAQFGLDQPADVDRPARDLSGFSEEDLNRPVADRKAEPNATGLGNVTRVPGTTTYEQWLRGQSQAVQDKVLGHGKAELFRNGDVSLRDLIRKDGTVRPLSELLEG
jgi:SPP1 gp7 family putative phage head morphogenesis protein